MTTIRPAPLVLVVGLALTGCGREAAEPATPPPETAPASPVAAPPAPAIPYACESGRTVQVAYGDDDTARVTYEGRTHVLRIAVSASGARYTGSGLEWWSANRGGRETATLSRVGPEDQAGTVVLERCTGPDTPRAAPSPTPASGAALFADGAAIPACRASALRLAAGTVEAGAGNRTQTFSLTNASASPCRIAGYPAVSLSDAGGDAVTGVRADQNAGLASPVTLGARDRAWFSVAWTVVPSDAECPSVARIDVRIPGDATALTVPASLSPCGGRIRVDPLRDTETVVVGG